MAASTLITLRQRSGAFETHGRAATRPLAAYRLGLVTNLTNVKAAVFAVAFIPQFVPRSFPLGLGIVILGAVQSLVSLGWYYVLVSFVDRAATALACPALRRGLTAISALGLLTLAIALFFSSPR